MEKELNYDATKAVAEEILKRLKKDEANEVTTELLKDSIRQGFSEKQVMKLATICNNIIDENRA